jgi:hypothetical protein
MTTTYAANAAANGSGTDLTANLTVTPTYGAAGVDYQLTATTALWVTQLEPTGQGVYIPDPIQAIFEGTDASKDAYGIKELVLDCKYQNDPNKTANFASYILGIAKDPAYTIDACPVWANYNANNMTAFFELEPGSKINIQETVTGISGEYFINGYNAQIVAGQYVLWTPILVSNPGYVGNYALNFGDAYPAGPDYWHQYAQFTNTANIDNLASKTIAFWVYINGSPTQVVSWWLWLSKGIWGLRRESGLANLKFYYTFSGNSGQWTFACPADATWTHIAITYNNSLIANEPIIYINGTATAATASTQPTGTAASDVGNYLEINARGAPDFCKYQDVRVYNRILSAAEIGQIYSLRSYSSVPSGLKFQVSNIEGPDGTAVTRARDTVSGTYGVVEGATAFEKAYMP